MPTAEKLLEMKEAEENARAEAVDTDITPLVAYMRKKRDEKARRLKVRCVIFKVHLKQRLTRLRLPKEQESGRRRKEAQAKGETRERATARAAEERAGQARKGTLGEEERARFKKARS